METQYLNHPILSYQLAESLLYHWSHFPLLLPPSITEHNAGRDDIQVRNIL